MKLLSVFPTLTLIYIGLVVAQDCVNVALTAIPNCAQNCILNGAPSIGCQGTDFNCQCAQSAALFAAVEGCVSTACPTASYQAVIDGASTVCDCASPSVVAGVAGTASVSGFGTVSAPVYNTASTTAAATATATATAKQTSASTSAGGTVTTGGITSSAGNGNIWTGYTSVSNVATASVIGAGAQATPAVNVLRFVVPVVMAGAAMV